RGRAPRPLPALYGHPRRPCRGAHRGAHREAGAAMTYPHPGDDALDGLLDDIGATPAEAAHLREVLAEAEAEEAYGDPAPDPYGWDGFNDAASAMDAAHELDAQRLGEDIVASIERRPKAEDILTRAMRRIEAGTYTEAPAFAPARDGYGRYASACGDTDD